MINLQVSIVSYLDFAKAFDTVPRNRLNHKLRTYGIRGKVLNVEKTTTTGLNFRTDIVPLMC